MSKFFLARRRVSARRFASDTTRLVSDTLQPRLGSDDAALYLSAPRCIGGGAAFGEERGTEEEKEIGATPEAGMGSGS